MAYFYRPRTKYDGKVIFSVCLFVHRGRGGTPAHWSWSVVPGPLLGKGVPLISGPRSFPCSWLGGRGYLSQAQRRAPLLPPPPPPARTSTGIHLPSPPQETPWTEYSASGMPRAFSRRRTFLCIDANNSLDKRCQVNLMSHNW